MKENIKNEACNHQYKHVDTYNEMEDSQNQYYYYKVKVGECINCGKMTKIKIMTEF